MASLKFFYWSFCLRVSSMECQKERI